MDEHMPDGAPRLERDPFVGIHGTPCALTLASNVTTVAAWAVQLYRGQTFGRYFKNFQVG